MPELTTETTIFVIFSTSFIIGLSGALMPGPLLTLTISEVAKHGFWLGPLLVLGHGLLELLLVIALVFGLNQILDNETAAGVIGIIGGVVLIHMGMSTAQDGWRHVVMPSMSTMGSDIKRKSVVSGVLVSIVNPYWFIWWATIGMYYLLWSLKLGATGVVSFFSGHILADLTWYTLIAYVVSRGKRVISNTVYRWLLIICGLALIILGFYFLVSGIMFLT